MSDALRCPTCGVSFADEDYCPVHGVRLEPPPAPQPAVAGLPEDAHAAVAATETGSHGPIDSGPEVADAPAPAAGVAPVDAAPATASESRDGRLADFMRRMGLRRANAPDPSAQGPAQAPDAPPAAPSPLPRELARQGWHIRGTVEAHPGFERWSVERTGEPGDFHRFRTEALTPHALYRRLETTALPGLPRVHGYGTVDLAGARADYELVSTPTPAMGLDRWLADSTPCEQRALHLLPLLADLLVDLDGSGLCALSLDPSLLLMAGDVGLTLNSAARLGETAAMGSYRPELERSALLATTWTAPEITQRGLPAANSMVFSAGQVLAHALWGQTCVAADVAHGAVTFHGIRDARLARVLMGCLWPRPGERWSPRQLHLAAGAADIAALPETPPWESLAPGAAPSAFTFAGSAYWRLESLLAAAVLPERWSEALVRLEAILAWAQETAWAGQATLVAQALASGRSRDWALVALAHAVRPEAPLTWRSLDLSDPHAARSLARLAQDALHGDPARVATLRDLFRADLRGAWTPASPAP